MADSPTHHQDDANLSSRATYRPWGAITSLLEEAGVS